MKSFTISLFFLYVFCFNVFSQDYKVRIACIGNSITYGAGLSNPATQNYPAQLQLLLQEKYGDTCQVVGFGVSGRTMLKHGDFPIWVEPQFANALKFVPNICLILLGTNDTKPQNWDPYGDEYFDDYMAMIDTFKSQNPYTKFITCYPPPAYEVVWDIRDSVIVNGVIPVVDSIIDETGSTLVDFYYPLLDSVYLFPDYIHPDAKGSKVMAEIIYDRLIETDLIHQVETGLTFISSFSADRQEISATDTAILSWTTLSAETVFLDDQPVPVNGSIKVSPDVNTTYRIYANGPKINDSSEITIYVYVPVLDSIKIIPGQKSVYGGDSVKISLEYLDQYTYAMKDASFDVSWTLLQGIGNLIPVTEKQAIFVGYKKGTAIIEAEAEGITARSNLQVRTDATEVSQQTLENTILVYPNPVSHVINFQLETENSTQVELKIYTLTGAIKNQSNFQLNVPGKNIVTLDTSEFGEGLFFYEISYDDKKFMGKMLIE